MARLLGVFLMVVVLYAVLMVSFPFAFTNENHQVLSRYLGFYGVLTIGVGVLIVAGGIDLSIGSMVALSAVCFGLLMKAGCHPLFSAVVVVLGGGLIGELHGLLVTKLRLQPFLVTLCGLFMYRGLARWASDQTSVGLPRDKSADPLREWLVSGDVLGISNELILLLVIAALLGVFLHGSVYGRYLYAIGHNKQAARYAGIMTDRYEILAYIICSTLASLGGVLFLLDNRSAQPTSAGTLLELYAITGAVLGGCTLRGGEGTVVGMLLGAAILPLLRQICNFSPYIGSNLEYTVIGAALLLGTIANELLAKKQG